MKTKSNPALTWLPSVVSLTAALIFTAAFAHAQDESKAGADPEIQRLLKEGLFAEEASGDLAKAAQAYRGVLERFDADRRFAASSALRLAEILREQAGSDAELPAESAALYRRVLKEFGDQTALAKVARERLGISASESVAEDEEEDEDLERLGELKQMLEQSPDLVDKPDSGGPPLVWVAGDGHLKSLQFLLANNADPNGVGSWKPLKTAVESGQLQAAKMLIEAGAEIGDTLHRAIATGNLSMVNLLLEAGADQNASVPIKGIDPRFKNSPREVILQGWAESVPPWKMPLGKSETYTPLQFAVFRDFPQIAERLIEAGAKTDVVDELVLHFTLWNNSLTLLKQLVDAGLDVNSLGGRELSPLHLAAALNDLRAVEVLLGDPDIEMNAVEQNGRSPIFFGNPAVIKTLAEAGAEVDQVDKSGYRPIQIAMSQTKIPEIIALIEAGASIDDVNYNGVTALGWAATFGNVELTRALLKAGADPMAEGSGTETALQRAIAKKNIDTFKALLEAGADPTKPNSAGKTTLHSAAKSGSGQIVSVLLEAGVDPNALDFSGNTPLHTAVKTGASTVVDLLIKGGADVKIKNADGMEPIGLIGENGSALIRSLVTAGADVNSAGLQGNTPIYHAVQMFDEKLGNWLLDQGAIPMARGVPVYQLFDWSKRQGSSDFQARLYRGAHLLPENRSGIIRAEIPERGETICFKKGVAGADGKFRAPGISLLEAFACGGAGVDLDQARLWRSGTDQPELINLREIIESGDPKRDIDLEWGDYVEFKLARDRTTTFVSKKARTFLDEHLKRRVQIANIGGTLGIAWYEAYPIIWLSSGDRVRVKERGEHAILQPNADPKRLDGFLSLLPSSQMMRVGEDSYAVVETLELVDGKEVYVAAPDLDGIVEDGIDHVRITSSRKPRTDRVLQKARSR